MEVKVGESYYTKAGWPTGLLEDAGNGLFKDPLSRFLFDEMGDCVKTENGTSTHYFKLVSRVREQEVKSEEEVVDAIAKAETLGNATVEDILNIQDSGL